MICPDSLFNTCIIGRFVIQEKTRFRPAVVYIVMYAGRHTQYINEQYDRYKYVYKMFHQKSNCIVTLNEPIVFTAIHNNAEKLKEEKRSGKARQCLPFLRSISK